MSGRNQLQWAYLFTSFAFLLSVGTALILSADSTFTQLELFKLDHYSSPPDEQTQTKLESLHNHALTMIVIGIILLASSVPLSSYIYWKIR